MHHNGAVKIYHDNEQFLTKDLLLFSIINLHYYYNNNKEAGIISHNINEIS